MYKYMSKWIHKLPHFVFIQFSHSAFTFFPLELALHENRTARGGLTYKPELQELPSLWLDSLNVYECVSSSFSFFFFYHVYWNRKSCLGKDVNSNSVRSSHWSVRWSVLLLMNMPKPRQLEHNSERCEKKNKKIKKLMGIYTPALLHKSLHACSPFYLCRISSLFMTVIDMLINMFIALIIITIILP